MEGTGANLRLPLNPPFFFESNVNYDRTTGAGTLVHRLRRPGAGHDAHRQRPRLRPEPAAAVHPPVQRVRRVPGDRPRCPPRWATSATAPTTWSRRSRATRPSPAWATRRRGRPRPSRRPLYPYQPLITTIAIDLSRAEERLQLAPGERPPARVARPRVPGLVHLGKGYTDNRGYYGAGGFAATEGAYWQNTYDQDAEWGPAFHDIRHNFVFSANYELPMGQGAGSGARTGHAHRRHPRRLEAGRHLPGPHRHPRHRHRRGDRSLQAERGFERPNCVGDWKPANQTSPRTRPRRPTRAGSTSTPSRGPPSGRSATARSASRGRRATRTSTWCSRSGSTWAGRGTSSSASRPSTPSTTRTSAPPARDINVPNTFGLITGTMGAPRVIELALKFYF